MTTALLIQLAIVVIPTAVVIAVTWRLGDRP